MNKTLLKDKLKSYSALASAVFGTAAAADAQLNYTDVAPDTVLTITNNTLNAYEVDFNNDNSVDVAIGTYGYLYGAYQLNYSFTILPNYTTAVLATAGAYGGEVTGLANAAAISPASTDWTDYGTDSSSFLFNLAAATGLGPLAGTMATGSDQCIGVRFVAGANTHYGWVRIQISTDALTTTIKDYAFNTVPNTGLNCGETGLGINEMPASQWFASTSGKNIIVSAKVDGALTVVDATGRVVATGEVVNGTANIAMTEANAGIYVVKFENGSATGTKKVVLQ